MRFLYGVLAAILTFTAANAAGPSAGQSAPETPIGEKSVADKRGMAIAPGPANRSAATALTPGQADSGAGSANGAAGRGNSGVATAPAAAPAAPVLPVSADEVVRHLSRTLSWYRLAGELQRLPADAEDVIPRERLSQTATTTVQLAFAFAHAAALLAKQAPAAGADSADESQDSAVDQAAARVADRINDLQGQLTDLDSQLAAAGPKDRPTLQARRGEVAAALDFSKEIQGTLGQIQKFEASTDVGGNGASGGLAAQIVDLQKSVPEIPLKSCTVRDAGGTTHTNSTSSPAVDCGSSSGGSAAGAGSPATGAAAPGAAAAAAASTAANSSLSFRAESAGIISLIGKWFSLQAVHRHLNDAQKQTAALAKDLQGIRDTVTQSARQLASQSLQATSTDPAQLAQSKLKFEAASARFKQLSTLLVPIGEQAITVDNALSIVDDWRESVAARSATVARYLLLRLGVLLGSIAVVLVISEVWRRATFRYLHDSRRRAQFLALRRVAVGLALTIVIVFGLVSEFGSLATYAGLITAGLAVALQNVILAVVAYFFLIGRYGVRVGDRVTLAGVTGRVVEIGLVRIYLMELTGPELRSSGRMVVLSNAVLFQPTALFKQMPGGDFFWHTIVMTLAATADVEDAEKRLAAAAESVYANYKLTIEQQHAALQRFIDFETKLPSPEVYARLTDKGLECTVRYPVDPARAAIIDQRMLTALREAQNQPPVLELVGGPLLTAES